MSASDNPPPATTVSLATHGGGQELRLPNEGMLWVGPESSIALQVSDETGALVRLYAGEVLLHVQAGEGMRWIVEVGDFGVEALGTRFRVRHTPGVPEVHVEEGAVRLVGPGLPREGLQIAAPRNADAKTHAVREASARDIAVEPPEAPASALLEGTVDPTEAEDLAQTHRIPERQPQLAWLVRFREAIDAGDTAGAVVALPPAFPTGRERIDAADFLDAGDALAARQQIERAERAYEAACRRRSTATCGVATFRLGLLAARRKDLDAAIAFATRYLEEHPKGSLVREVFGRRMQWHVTKGNAQAARKDARAYVARWPEGPHAPLARRILSAP